MNYLDKENQSNMNLHHNNIIRTLRKWNEANEGATTEELRLLQRSLEIALSDVKTIISLRESDEKES